MAIKFIDNYPRKNLEDVIHDSHGSPLYGEIWVYEELLKFNENNFLGDEIWYVKHNYNLSTHPASETKIEGQIDFLILSKYGLLIVEVKGGGIGIDENDSWYSYRLQDTNERYVSQNPFTQAKEYVHSLKALIDSDIFIYRAVIFPHEANFKLIGPQLSGYEYLFFSKRNLDEKTSEYAKNQGLFEFLNRLPHESRKHILSQLNPQMDRQTLNERIFQKFPLLSRKEIERTRSELWPVQNIYGFDPNKIKDEILLKENYEILKGLRKNRKVIVQGTAGTGKTTLATKFIAEKLLRQQKGIFLCANKLVRSKLEYLIINEYKLDPNSISFKVFTENFNFNEYREGLDFIIFDECQEFLVKNLFELVLDLDKKFSNPYVLLLLDPEQTILQDFKELDWYINFFIELGFVHYLFDTVWRCIRNPELIEFTSWVWHNNIKRLSESKVIVRVSDLTSKLKEIKSIVDRFNNKSTDVTILIISTLFDSFDEIVKDYFKNDITELTSENINLRTSKIKYTTPIKYRGLESDVIILITSGFTERTRTENYVGATRAIYKLNVILWN